VDIGDAVDFAKVVAKALLIATIYSVPALVAAYRGHSRAEKIALLNLLLGWTVLGWLVALAWALRRPRLSWRAGR
jgi:Superinfection immunity protein